MEIKKEKPWIKGYHHPTKIKLANARIVQKALAAQKPECQLIQDEKDKDYYTLICWSEHTFWTALFIFEFIAGADVAAGLKE